MVHHLRAAHVGIPRAAGVFMDVPFIGESTSSLIRRAAACYGLRAKDLRSGWKWRNYQPQHDGGTARLDAEVLLNES